jgi:hypothetical protein
MWDDEKGEWRVVVDLDWPRSKTPGIPYGSKIGWILVWELIPGRHDSEITAAGDKTDIREAHIINEAIYAGVIDAGNAQDRPVIKKAPPATLATPVASKDKKRITHNHDREHRS